MNINLVVKKDVLFEKQNVVVPVFEEHVSEEKVYSFLGMLTRSQKAYLKKIVEKNEFKGKNGSFLKFEYEAKDKTIKTIYLFGIGKKADFKVIGFKRVISKIIKKVTDGILSSVAFYLPWTTKSYELDAIYVKTYIGIKLASYQFDKYKKKDENKKVIAECDIFVNSLTDKFDEKYLAYLNDYCLKLTDSIILSRNIVNEPPIVMYPEVFKNEVVKIFKDKKNVKVNVMDYKEIVKKGFNLLAAVGKGSDKKPYFIEIIYNCGKKDAKTLALVGKGLTYDSGGYSLKPADSMKGMHLDMHGAVTMVGTMDIITNYPLDFNVKAYLVVAENMVSGDAYKVSDIVKSYLGKTVEILNTDAEGRLALADGIAYACEQGADVLIEASTLTGAALVALGGEIAALLSNNDVLANSIQEAGVLTEEKFWRLPLEESYKEEIKSSVADLRNIGKTRFAGTITAGLFLAEFVKEGVKFAHLDIAGPAMLDKDIDFYNAGGNGFAIETLCQLILRGKLF